MASDSPRIAVAGMLAEARRFQEGTARGFVAFLRDEQTHFFLITALVGVGAGLVALGVRSLSALVTRIAYMGWHGDAFETIRAAPWWLRLAVPALGAAVAGLIVQHAARRGPSSGMGAIMEAVTLRHGFVSLRRALWTAAASVVAIATGGSVGREGPITQVSCAIGSRLGRSFRLSEARVRLLVAAGAGAGIAAAYNTPIAGTLFVLEVVVGSFATDLIGTTVIAAVVGTLVARIYLWGGPIYDVPEFVFRTPQEILAYAGLGIACGFLAASFLGLMRVGEATFNRIHAPRWVRTGIGGLIIGALALQLPAVCGNGYETLMNILNARIGWISLAILLVAKMFATTASVTSGSPGGVFTPTLFIGAALGGVAGHLLHGVFPASTGGPSSYALVGMGALLAATTHAPITATVLIAELTGDYFVVLPQLLACGLASTVTHRIDSVYTHELRRRGITWEGTLEQKIVHSIKARDIMRTDVPLLAPQTPFQEVVRLFTTTRTPCLYVGDGSGNLLGVIELHAVKELLGSDDVSNLVIAQDLATPPRSVAADASLAAVNEKLWFIDTGEAPVVESSADPRFLGVVTQRDLLGFLDREILRRNLLLSEVRWRDGLEKGIEYLELPEGYRLEALPVPADLVGKTVEQAQLRSRHGLNVIAIASIDVHGNERRYPPEHDHRLRPGDRLVVVASSEDVEAFGKTPRSPV
jgi:CIC family chloride channel protein